MGEYSNYLGKEPTLLQARFAEWCIGENVGYDPSSAKNKDEAFREGVRLGTALRIHFQASPENQQARAEEVTARQNGAASAEEKPKAPRGRPKKAVAEAAPVAEEAPAPKKSTGRSKKATAAAAAPVAEEIPAPKPTKRGARKATASATPAPF